ncbi:hypothetical protein B0H14DRAFT_2627570 [Mycena olivaceomarginata]|nr:hypothetical protein B0H14DRAFT_2627570 [Mycena olivaceomarginata]
MPRISVSSPAIHIRHNGQAIASVQDLPPLEQQGEKRVLVGEDVLGDGPVPKRRKKMGSKRTTGSKNPFILAGVWNHHNLTVLETEFARTRYRPKCRTATATKPLYHRTVPHHYRIEIDRFRGITVTKSSNYRYIGHTHPSGYFYCIKEDPHSAVPYTVSAQSLGTMCAASHYRFGCGDAVVMRLEAVIEDSVRVDTYHTPTSPKSEIFEFGVVQFESAVVEISGRGCGLRISKKNPQSIKHSIPGIVRVAN